MDREANLPVPPNKSPKNLFRPIINRDRSSSSSSSPELLRHVQAAFKRHRHLSKMQTSTIGPRRSVAPQRGASGSSGLNAATTADVKRCQDVISLSHSHATSNLTQDTSNMTATGPRRSVAPQRGASGSSGLTAAITADMKRSQDVISLGHSHATSNLTQDTRNMTTNLAGESLEYVSITPPSISGTISKTCDENLNPFDRQTDLSKPAIASKGSNHLEPQNLDGHKKFQSLTGNTLTSQDMEWDAANQAEVSNLDAHNKPRHQNFGTVESEFSLKSECGVSSSLAKIQGQLYQFKNFINQPASQFSVAGSSCATTTSIHSSSAPMLNATTHVSRSYEEGNNSAILEPLADTNANNQAVKSQGDVLQSLHPSQKDSNTMQVDHGAIASQSSASAIDPETEFKEPDKPRHRQGTTGIEVPGVSSSRPNDLQSKAPSSKDLPTNEIAQPRKPDKHEKIASSKRASAPRKRNYDPDLFFKVNGKLYQRLGKIGSGGSSEVHKVISSDCTIYALKKIKLKGRDYATAYGFCQEIEYLKKLKGKTNIIQLIDFEVTDKTLLREVMNGTMNNKDGRVKDDGYIYMVLEYGEIDLAHMLSQKWKEIEGSHPTIDENWLRFYWQQILQAVNTIHEERIVHSDLKPANFLLVRGSLKLIDFGIAKAINSDTTNIQRDSQVGTLSYMSPEAFMCNESDADGNAIKCGRPSDIWSLGCILYQMVYGRTPFADYKSFWAKFKVITDPNHGITYGPVSNPWLLDLMKKCLAWDRTKRWRIPQLLHHPFLVPPIPPEPQDQYSKILNLIVESRGTNQRASSLISQLGKLLIDPPITDLLISREQQCEVLSRVSELCLQLQDQLSRLEEE